MGIDRLSELERDALKEMANIGSGHAATAMSRLLDRNVIIRVPRVMSGAIQDMAVELYHKHAHLAAVFLEFSGDISGKALIAFRQKTVENLSKMLLPSGTIPDEDASNSLIKEIANIVFCSYLNALGALLHFTIMPSVPTMKSEFNYELQKNASLPWLQTNEMILGLETELFFTEEKQLFRAIFFIAPDTTSVQSILQALRVSQ